MNLLEEISAFHILLIAIIVILILVLFFRVRLKFLLIRMVYGRYHFKYLRLFNRYFINRPYPDAIKDEPWDYVNNSFKSKPGLQFKTDEEIQFVDNKVGEVYPRFFKIIGDPDYLTISDPGQKHIQFIVASYKAMVYDYQAMLVYYFVDSLLVMGQFRFRREKQALDINHLIEKLRERYKIDIPQGINKPFQLIDRNDNCINFRDNGFSVELNVLNYKNQKILNILNDHPLNATAGDEVADKQVVTF